MLLEMVVAESTLLVASLLGTCLPFPTTTSASVFSCGSNSAHGAGGQQAVCRRPPGWSWYPSATVAWLLLLSCWQLELGHRNIYTMETGSCYVPTPLSHPGGG